MNNKKKIIVIILGVLDVRLPDDYPIDYLFYLIYYFLYIIIIIIFFTFFFIHVSFQYEEQESWEAPSFDRQERPAPAEPFPVPSEASPSFSGVLQTPSLQQPSTSRFVMLSAFAVSFCN